MSKSHKSVRSRKLNSKTKKSERSSLSNASVLIKQQAELEAAKVRHKYIEQESEILLKKAALEDDLKLLTSKRDIDEAETKVKTIRNMLDEDLSDNSSNDSEVVQNIIRRRTEEFVSEIMWPYCAYRFETRTTTT